MQPILIPIANGSEELEAVTLITVLRRAKLEVIVASIHELQITGARQFKLVADTLLADCLHQQFSLIALPGGIEGAKALSAHQPLITLLKQQKESGLYYAAICAAPALVFAPHGLIDGLKATCFPALSSELTGAILSSDEVVVDKNCITSRGPATALAFSLKLVELLCGPAQANQVAQDMLVNR